jgi:hypothetical protein
MTQDAIEKVLAAHRPYIDSYEDIRCLCGEICVRDHNPNKAFSDSSFISHVAAALKEALDAEDKERG